MIPILPDFTRWSWASVTERQWWQPLFAHAQKTLRILERESVAAGHRPMCWQPVHAEDLIETTNWAQQHGLVCIPTLRTKHIDGYAAQSVAPQPGDKFLYRCVFVKPEHYPIRFSQNDREIGELLGYPQCCQDAFMETWGRGQVDSTWEQWTKTTGFTQRSPTDLWCHTLLRWMEIRLVPHMPCHYDCEESDQMARLLFELGHKLGYAEDMVLVKEVLNWPVTWSRLFGIAEITTPALKVSTRTDWTPEKDQFVKPGAYNKPSSWLWTDNGFSTPDAMRAAHSVLLQSLLNIPQGSRVFDLGCGNGLLLRRLKIQRPDLKIGGIDQSPSTIQHIPSLSGKWMTGQIKSCEWTSWNPDVLLVSIARLQRPWGDEMIQAFTAAKQVFVYAYPDTMWDDSLEELTTHIGAGTLQMLQKTPIVSVGLLCRS